MLMVILLAMLYYFISFTKHVEKSTSIQQNIHHLHTIHSQLRKLKPFDYHFLNFDTVNSDLKNFSSNLETIKKHLDELQNAPKYLYDAGMTPNY